MGLYREDYEIIEYLLQEKHLKKGFSVVECGSQDLLEDRNGTCIHDVDNRKPAKIIYEKYDCSSYKCIDLEGFHGALKFDLGKDLKKEYGFSEQFDIVTCKDIGHWVFDQKQLFTNLHDLCKPGGIIVWRSPLGGGFAQGCFAYHHYKILQLALSNNYVFLGGWITEYLHSPSGASKFPFCDRKEAEKLVCDTGVKFVGKGFIQAIEEYMGRMDSFRYLPMQRGLPAVCPTLMFVKQDDKPFNPPLFFYAPDEVTIKRNAKSVLRNCLPKPKKNTVAIFGSARAGRLAEIFAKECGLHVECFIDDFMQEGERIVSFDTFVNAKQESCDFILKGPSQGGNIEQRAGLKVPVCSLNMNWFVG